MTVSRRKAKSSPKIVSLEAELAVDVHPREDRVDVALVAVEVDGHLLLGHPRDAAELVDEVHVPGGAAELAVGRRAGGRAPPASAPPRGSPRPRSRAGRRRLPRAPAGAREGGGGCRRGRRGTAGSPSGPCGVYTTAVNPADLGVIDAAGALARRELSSRELTEACLARIAERDGTHSHDGDPGSINAWVRVYEEDARAAAAAADERIAAGDAPFLCGVPLGLKDLYAVAGKPLTASSKVLDETPDRDCDAWARLRAEGMVLLGHLHVHEFACGRDDRPGREPLGARALGRRVERRLQRGARLEAGARGDRHRHRRLAAHPLGGVRDVDDQADARAPLDPRDRPARPDLRPSRADDPDGARTASRCSRRWPASGPRRSVARSAAARSLRGSPTSIPTSPTASSERSPRSRASGSSRRSPRARLDVLGRVLRHGAHRDAGLAPPLPGPAGASTATRTAPGSSTPSSGR